MSDNSHNEYILAVDLGTSGPKTALVSTTGEVIDYSFEDVELLLLPNGGAEQRPEDWWAAIVKTARAVLEKSHVPVDRIIAVCCCSQWSGTVAVDQSGENIGNAVIWLDSRGSPFIKKIVDGLVKVEGYEIRKLYHWLTKTGGAPGLAGKDPIAHILYLKHEDPERYAQTYKFLEPQDYLNLKFSGHFATSYESVTLHWLTDNRDINNITYDDKLIRMSTVDRGKFPDLKKPGTILGPIKPEVADELGLSRNVQVVMGSPDVPCAAIGAGSTDDYDGHIYIGTSSWLTCHVPFKKTDIFHGMASLPSSIPGRYFVANEQETAGACLTYLRKNILFPDDELKVGAEPEDVFERLNTMVSGVPPGSGNVIFTPWLYGERTPVEDHTVRSTLFNQSLDTTRAQIVRAVFEGIAFNTKWLLKYVEKFINQRMDSIRMIGGGAISSVWCQIFADILDRTILQVNDPIKANVRGAAFLAAVALNKIEFKDIPDLVKIEGTFKPNSDNRERYDELFKEFVNIYKANKKIYRRLNRH